MRKENIYLLRFKKASKVRKLYSYVWSTIWLKISAVCPTLTKINKVFMEDSNRKHSSSIDVQSNQPFLKQFLCLSLSCLSVLFYSWLGFFLIFECFSQQYPSYFQIKHIIWYPVPLSHNNLDYISLWINKMTSKVLASSSL